MKLLKPLVASTSILVILRVALALLKYAVCDSNTNDEALTKIDDVWRVEGIVA